MKKQYKNILWDIDDTLIDFKSSEKMALKACFAHYGVILTDQDVAVYSEINHGYWEMLARGEIEKKVLLSKRFEDFTNHLSLDKFDFEAINDMYQENLGDYAVMFPYAYEVCTKLKESKKQYAVTNGTIVAQNKKLAKTGLREIFDEIFISDKIGHEKPDKRFFGHVFSQIPNFKLEETLLVGDTLSSDIMGANNVGIDCCWFNPSGKTNENPSIVINYEIKNLKEVLEIIL